MGGWGGGGGWGWGGCWGGGGGGGGVSSLEPSLRNTDTQMRRMNLLNLTIQQ